MIGNVYGTWLVTHAINRTDRRQRYTVRCVHCNTERQIESRKIRECLAWHRGCSKADPHVSKRMSHRRGSRAMPPSSSPLWAELSAKLDEDSSFADTLIPSMLENLLAWRDCRRMDRYTTTIDDLVSHRQPVRDVAL